MARIRSVKPEFWDSPDTISASLRARLLYIAMWNWADDYGIGDGNLGRLMNFAFPQDDLPAADFPTLAAEVSDCFGVVFYQHAGRPYYYIPKWEKHQRTEKKARQLVPYPQDADSASDQARESSEVSGGSSDAVRGSTVPGTRGTGEQEEQEEQEEQGEQPPRSGGRAKRATATPAPRFEEFWNAYPRHEGKPAAVTAWTKAVQRATPDTIIAGARRHAADPNRVQQYTKHPGPWLNADAWNDDPLPNRFGGRPDSSLDRRDRQREQMFTELALAELDTTNPFQQKAIGQ